MKIIIASQKRFLLVISLVLFCHFAHANSKLTEQFNIVGQGQMSWFFIDLYKASLYTQSGQYIEDIYPQALNIAYKRDIDKQDLLSATQKEWQKLGVDKQQSTAWLATLAMIWPDINKGDQLLFLVKSNGDGYFYHNNQLLGGINSMQFSKAFLSIWLSPNTSEPALRQRLLGK